MENSTKPKDFIFDAYLSDTCPMCCAHKDSHEHYAETISGGKVMALYFCCNECGADYIVGLGRSRMPIKSEILSV